eukprot:Skav218643  [mRNA]  locus=scaffold365:478204:481221:+ [translate_table: standard]
MADPGISVVDQGLTAATWIQIVSAMDWARVSISRLPMPILNILAWLSLCSTKLHVEAIQGHVMRDISDESVSLIQLTVSGAGASWPATQESPLMIR